MRGIRISQSRLAQLRAVELSSSPSSNARTEVMGNSNKLSMKNKVENSEKKPLSSFSSSHQRMSYFGLRAILLLLFAVLSLIFILLSGSLLIADRRDCSYLLSDPLTEEHLQTLANISFSEIQRRKEGGVEEDDPPPLRKSRYDTELKHVVFGINASSNLWEKRKDYIKQWWRPKETRGVVWLDKKVRIYRNEGLPEIRISGDTSKFKYTNRQGQRLALRISRLLLETLRLGLKDVRWFVMGDDDTVFVGDNVVRILLKYDHMQFHLLDHFFKG